MSREDLSRPPSDAVLLHAIVHDILASYPPGSILSMSNLLSKIRPQCPDSIDNEDIERAIVDGVHEFGFAVQFHKEP
jgi:hypothetical protein